MNASDQHSSCVGCSRIERDQLSCWLNLVGAVSRADVLEYEHVLDVHCSLGRTRVMFFLLFLGEITLCVYLHSVCTGKPVDEAFLLHLQEVLCLQAHYDFSVFKGRL